MSTGIHKDTVDISEKLRGHPNSSERKSKLQLVKLKRISSHSLATSDVPFTISSSSQRPTSAFLAPSKKTKAQQLASAFCFRVTIKKWQTTLKHTVFHTWVKYSSRNKRVNANKVSYYTARLGKDKLNKLRILGDWKNFALNSKIEKLKQIINLQQKEIDILEDNNKLITRSYQASAAGSYQLFAEFEIKAIGRRQKESELNLMISERDAKIKERTQLLVNMQGQHNIMSASLGIVLWTKNFERIEKQMSDLRNKLIYVQSVCDVSKLLQTIDGSVTTRIGLRKQDEEISCESINSLIALEPSEILLRWIKHLARDINYKLGPGYRQIGKHENNLEIYSLLFKHFGFLPEIPECENSLNEESNEDIDEQENEEKDDYSEEDSDDSESGEDSDEDEDEKSSSELTSVDNNNSDTTLKDNTEEGSGYTSNDIERSHESSTTDSESSDSSLTSSIDNSGETSTTTSSPDSESQSKISETSSRSEMNEKSSLQSSKSGSQKKKHSQSKGKKRKRKKNLPAVKNRKDSTNKLLSGIDEESNVKENISIIVEEKTEQKSIDRSSVSSETSLTSSESKIVNIVDLDKNETKLKVPSTLLRLSQVDMFDILLQKFPIFSPLIEYLKRIFPADALQNQENEIYHIMFLSILFQCEPKLYKEYTDFKIRVDNVMKSIFKLKCSESTAENSHQVWSILEKKIEEFDEGKDKNLIMLRHQKSIEKSIYIRWVEKFVNVLEEIHCLEREMDVILKYSLESDHIYSKICDKLQQKSMMYSLTLVEEEQKRKFESRVDNLEASLRASEEEITRLNTYISNSKAKQNRVSRRDSSLASIGPKRLSVNEMRRGTILESS